jgi:hypothetical protein
MPLALLREKTLAVKAKLLLNIPHESIAESLKISTRQVRRIKSNIVQHDAVCRSKIVPQGRKSKMTPEMMKVSPPLF